MTRYDRRSQILALCLAALAGYVDAVGFTASGGFFVSFMSGNSTRLGVGVAENTSGPLLAISAIMIAFVVGVAVGSALGYRAQAGRRFSILVLMTAIILIAAVSGEAGCTVLMVASLAFAMGSANAIFERSGEVGLGVTYMTGSLVRIGHGVAGWLIGESREGWVPYLFLWLSLVSGAILGASIYLTLELISVWLAAAISAALAIASTVLGRREQH